MTFREKSAWVCIAAILLVYGCYAFKLWGAPLRPLDAIGALVGSTVLMILITVAAHIAIALRTRPEKLDERDQLVALRSARNAFYVLATGVWAVMYLAIASPQPILLAYAAMSAFVLAELVRLASQVVYYRLGAWA